WAGANAVGVVNAGPVDVGCDRPNERETIKAAMTTTRAAAATIPRPSRMGGRPRLDPRRRPSPALMSVLLVRKLGLGLDPRARKRWVVLADLRGAAPHSECDNGQNDADQPDGQAGSAKNCCALRRGIGRRLRR